MASAEFKTNHLYNDKYRKELAGLLSQVKRSISTEFDKINWSEKAAFTIGYNKAVDDLTKFLLDNTEEM